MNDLFIVEAKDLVGRYGQTDYCIVKAETKSEAASKAEKKYSGELMENLNRDVAYPDCIVDFDEEGVSKIIRHVW